MCDDVEFSAEDATRTDWDYLEQVSRAVVAAGARTVNLPDTVGYSVPEEYAAMIGRMVKALGDSAIVSVHCHDDLGMAVANSLAALHAGARQIECCINGIGERAGNAALEEVVMAMNTRPDRLPFETRIVTEQLFAASQLLTSLITFGPQPNKAIVGENAFAHEAGIHQDGFLKERTTYEIMEPKSVGVPETQAGAGQAQRPSRAGEALAKISAFRCSATSWTWCISDSPRWRTARRGCATTKSPRWRAK